MRNKRLAAGLAIMGLVLTVGLWMRLFVDGDQFRPELERRMTAALGRKVSIGHLSLSLISRSAVIEKLSIADDPSFGEAPFLQAKSARVGIGVQSFRLHEPQLTLRRSKAGTWNVSTLGASSSSESNADPRLNLSIDTIGITNGRVIVETRGPNHMYEAVNLTARGFSSKKRFTFQMSATAPGNGVITFDGTAGPLGLSGLRAMPLDGKLAAEHLDPARAGLVEPGGGFAGLVDLDCRVASDGRRVVSTGTVRGARIRIMPGGSPAAVPVSLAFQSEYDLNTSVGVLKRGDLRIGRTSAQLNGRFNLAGNGATLQMTLAGHHMSIPDLEATLPAVGIRTPQGARFASGTLDTNLAIVGSPARLSMAGPVTLSNAALVGFDLGSQMRTAAFLAGIPTSPTTMIQTLTASLHIAPGGVRVDGLNALVPSIGIFTGAGTISPSGGLNFNLLTKLNRSASLQGQLLSAATLGYSEQAFRLHVTGTIDKPIFVPDVPSAAGSFAKRANPLSTGAGFLGKLLGKWK